jgi:syndecan 2
MLSAILLVMFIIYRMRKKDEGSYVLEEAPQKSPSHAYTRVSSREFFA